MRFEREEAKEMVGNQLPCHSFSVDFEVVGLLVTCHFWIMSVMM
jgi:hypothetical protein